VLDVEHAAAEYGISRRHLHRLLARYRERGLDALEPRSRPRTIPIATPEEVRERVLELRVQLTADGLDAGPETIRWHLLQGGLRAPSTSTIRRILHQTGLIEPEPKKRPRSSCVRFEMAQPNEMWQSDFIHWRLADGGGVEVLNWLDDLPLPALLHSAPAGDRRSCGGRIPRADRAIRPTRVDAGR
jgi:transposase